MFLLIRHLIDLFAQRGWRLSQFLSFNFKFSEIRQSRILERSLDEHMRFLATSFLTISRLMLVFVLGMSSVASAKSVFDRRSWSAFRGAKHSPARVFGARAFSSSRFVAQMTDAQAANVKVVGEKGAKGLEKTALSKEGLKENAFLAPVDDDDGLSDSKRFTEGLRAFEFGDCRRVTSLLDTLALPGHLADPNRLIEVHRMLGVCYLQLEQKKRARAELKALLYLKSDYVLDPFLTPPAVIEIFEEERQAVLRKLDAINRAKAKREKQNALLIERTTTVEYTPFWSIFLPFGGAQIANNEPIKASVIGGLMGVSLLTNIGAFWTQQGICFSKTTKTGTCTYPRDKSATGISTDSSVWQNAHVTAQVVSASALAAFTLVYFYSIADGWWNWVPERVVKTDEKKRALTPEDQSAQESIP